MNSRMKRSSAIFLQVVIVLFGMGVLTFMIWEPTVEGVNAHATLFQIYFNFFVAYVYIASIPFFVGLYQALKVLGYAGKNKVFSPEAVKALRTIKLCAITIISFVVVSVIFMINGGPEDRPPGVMMRLFVIFGSIVVATAAAIFERILQNAVDIKSENDLTV
jgi:hypothetical protein